MLTPSDEPLGIIIAKFVPHGSPFVICMVVRVRPTEPEEVFCTYRPPVGRFITRLFQVIRGEHPDQMPVECGAWVEARMVQVVFLEEQFHRSVGEGQDFPHHSFEGQILNLLVRSVVAQFTTANTAFSGEGDEGADVRHFCATVGDLLVGKQCSGGMFGRPNLERDMVTIVDSA